MNLEEKIRKGVDYLIEQSENKLNALGSVEKGKFVPTDPVIYKKYKTQIEFRLRFVEAVDELLKQHILLSEGVLAMVKQLESGEINQEDLDGLKSYASKIKS